ncbi:ferric reductase-like transmembrane domain-containing protein [Phycicoccus sp. CSK15P-2]|uniref:ferredoxin reductase family protein n=1 Tax=Phycicoccus sp. CSK15P-2 TaxID=2807627 RepID=UPI00194F83FE|nr:ferredoxin reductase family protein [Phycicoccus sp. CSK15P-2]MBM6404702.1 ferric reductase-like transmembrane domain-containing protein [Phycicoccus sp. CSK15P-2]
MTTSTVTADGAPARGRHAGPAPRPNGPVPRWWRDATGTLGWAVVLGVGALWVAGGGVQDLGSLAGALTSTGRLTGLVASALLLLQVILMARVPWVEQAWGQDELARVHRLVGFTSFSLLLGHIVLITLGYAASGPLGLWGTTWDFVVGYPGMLLAWAGTTALVMVVVTSVRRARRRLRYESWHLIHLYGYVGAGLVLPHQLWTGADFLDSTPATVFWWGLWGVTAAAVLAFRVGVPLWRSLRSPIRVLDVRPEGPGATTVTVGGDGVRHLRVRAGQFLQWRFLDGPGWSRAHPYSVSAAPDGRTLRITAAHVGDGSARLATLRPGTRVLVEGPYGRLHGGVRTRRKVLLMGSGIGVTPLRALLEELPQQPGDVTVVHRVRTREAAVLADEIRALAAARGARYVQVEGPRVPGRASWLPRQAAHLSDAEALREVVPDIAEHDVYLCGGDGWLTAAHAAVREAGAPADAVHLERFAS